MKDYGLQGYELTNHKAVPLLAGLSGDNYELIRSRVRISAIEKGEQVFTAGEPATHMYIIYRGNVKISTHMPDGREQILYIYKTGEFVGGLNILSGDYYAYTCTALADSFIVTLASKDVRTILMRDENFLFQLLEMSYERIRFSEALVDVLSTPNADQRVAKVLLNLSERFGQPEKRGIMLSTNLNREELGSYAGVTRETMSRKIHQFEDENLLKILPKGDLLILDTKGLKEKTV